MIDTILKKGYFDNSIFMLLARLRRISVNRSRFKRNVGEGLCALPNMIDDIGQARRPVPTKVLIFVLTFLLISACAKQDDQTLEHQDPVEAIVQVSEDRTQEREEFPLPELTSDNIKNVNALVMEQMRQELINESSQQTFEEAHVGKIEIGEVEKPELEIEIESPVFALEPEKQN